MSKPAEAFEKALQALKDNAVIVEDENSSIEQAIAAYEQGAKHYQQCLEILNNAEQRVHVISEELKQIGETNDE